MADTTSRYRIPDGLRVYAFGDIHGRLDLLERLLETVERDAQGHEGVRLVFLGDYVDRGPDSRAVIERVLRLQQERGAICLTGNHEAMMRAALDGSGPLDRWLGNGGVAALASYGVAAEDVGGKALRRAAREAIPPEHAAFLAGLGFSAEFGDYFFCHAGVRPGVALERQTAHDLIWIRRVFLDSTADFGKRVVHGHTPVEEVDIRANRINVDTGAWKTGRLSCVVLEGAEVRVLQS
ncbi:serine/threonine protein phosphatase [Ancylobacter sp. Lp-2]|uniref:metallophosphoesterase family protein n=1 Tax=Ancylobacter sp. Lp-2 TaxID=2881339 RepID=UPI001E612D96|nr:metallophosphoesterase family protein [Ancylobacter sp. Lp-2]MCB4770224.1 serine/threonine protein phosphatase [Ancylobacter sp. Lp-2]